MSAYIVGHRCYVYRGVRLEKCVYSILRYGEWARDFGRIVKDGYVYSRKRERERKSMSANFSSTDEEIGALPSEFCSDFTTRR